MKTTEHINDFIFDLNLAKSAISKTKLTEAPAMMLVLNGIIERLERILQSSLQDELAINMLTAKKEA